MPTRRIANPDGLGQNQKQPDRARRAILTGGAVGLAAVAGSTLSWSQPASALANTQPVVALQPSGDESGATDAANIMDAFNALPSVVDTDITGVSYQVGTVLLGPGNFYVKTKINKPPKVDLIGSGPGTVIFVVGDITGIYSHHDETFPTPAGSFQHFTKSGTIANLVVDGTQAGINSRGIDIGDGWGHRIEHVWINNFTGATAIGLSVCNRNFWTEKFYARHVNLINNTTGAQHWTVVGANSQEYQDVSYFIWADNNQNGVTFQGVKWNGKLALEGNIGVLSTAGTNWMVGFLSDVAGNGGGPSNVTAECCINYEVNVMGIMPPPQPPNPYSLYFGPPTGTNLASTFAGSGLIRSAGGGNGTGGGSCNATPGQFQFRGLIEESNQSMQAVTTPAVPGSGASVPNNQNDCMVYFSVSGGSVTEVQVSGSTTGITGVTSGQVFLPSQGPLPASGTQGTIKITYTGTLSWKWVSVI